MTVGQRRFVVALIAVAVAVLIVVGVRNRFWPKSQPDDQPPKRAATTPPTTQPYQIGHAPTTDTAPVPPTQPAPPIPPTGGKITAADRAKALTLLGRGLGLCKQEKLIAARAVLADALNSGALPAEQAESARAKLSELADKTLFSRRVIEGDPCTFWYTFKPGDILVRVERKLKLRVPSQLVLKINGIPDARRIQAGQTFKMVRGPFHALVSKSRFIMDVFLQEPKTGRMIFVRRFRVGVGKDGSTPTGRWRIALGGKIVRAPWTPPSSSDLPRRKILWGRPGYPLGAKGYWISIEGIDGNPHTIEDGYGIHGTDDPTTIGRASSMGCIRLSDDDIEVLFALLYEHWSTVTILP